MSVKQLVIGALNAPNGQTSGELGGQAAVFFKTVAYSDKPLRGEVQVIQRYEEGCGRVRLTFIQPDALDRSGKRQDLKAAIEMNICPDGTPYIAAEHRDTSRNWARE